MILSPSDKLNPLWVRLMSHWNARLEQHRTQLEGNKSETDTAIFRGRIAEIRACMRLNEEVPAALE